MRKSAWIAGACLGLVCGGFAPSWAQRVGKNAGGGATVAALAAAQSEAEKSRIFMKLRKDVTPADVLAILRSEPSEMIAGMAVGCCLESVNVSPREAAELLWTLAQRPEAAGLAATLGAVSGQAAAIADVLAGLPARPGPANPHLLAAEILATYATVLEQGAPAAEDGPVRAGRGGKRRREAQHFDQHAVSAAAAPLGILLKSKDAEVVEAALVAGARLRLTELQAAIDTRTDLRAPGVLAARLLYLAKTGAPLPDELVEQVFTAAPGPAAPKTPAAKTPVPRTPTVRAPASKTPAAKYPASKVPARASGTETRLYSYAIRTPPLTYGCQALASAPDTAREKYLPRLHAALQDRDLRVQIDAARALEAIGADESLAPLLEKVAGDTPWPVLVPVLSAVGAIPAANAVPALIARLKQEQGRLRLDVNYALASVVGSQAGQTADQWQAWWDQNGASWTVDRARTQTFRQQHAVTDMQVAALGSFYNLELASDRVVFAVDTSMSMHGEKFSSLKVHLGRTVGGLAPHVQFNVVDFGGVITVMKTYGLITKAEIPTAVERIGQLTLSGGTRAYDALELAMAQPGADTLILLSDGAPVCGKFDAWPRLIGALGILTRYWPVSIWGLEFASRGANHAAMQELATRHHGRSRSSEP